MLGFLRNLFPFYRVRYSNKAIRILIVSDALFFSGIALVEVVFSVFIVTRIPGATVVNLGIGNAIFMLGVILSEALFSRFYDHADDNTTFNGILFANLLKAAFRLIFIFISSVDMFYVVFFILGIVHAMEYPAFAKVFSKHLDSGHESSNWGLKDLFLSLGKLLAFFSSGYIALYFGYEVLFALAAFVMFISGVVLPSIFRKEFVQ
jgi:hypothetical protein